MLRSYRFVMVIAAMTVVGDARAVAISDLPVMGSAESPALLLELGADPPSKATAVGGVEMVHGELSGQDQGITSQLETDDLVSRHPGFGHWATAFRFALKSAPSTQPYTFWARWRQGGEPAVCEQTFELWAGPDNGQLERRAEFKLKPKGWEYAWIAAETPVALQPGDTVIEIRESGAGHDAKVFDAFLLGPPSPPSPLPSQTARDKSAVLLELGKAPKWATAAKSDGLQVRMGRITTHSGTGGVIEEKDEVQVLHPGFGQWDVSFRFDLTPAIPPGKYQLSARYKSGGEVSQVAQTFSVKAGSDLQNLAERARFMLNNNTPWEYQWLASNGTLAILPGDRFVDIENSGQADGAKVFDAFLLQLEAPLPGDMTVRDAALRNRFLASVKPVEHPDRRLYVLDNGSAADPILFAGLADKSAQPYLEKMQVTYLLGAEAESMAHALNLASLPAALLCDGSYSLLGVLANPKTVTAVSQFLVDAQHHGTQPNSPTVADEPPQPLRDGVPQFWLVGGVQQGIAGVSLFGVDAEATLRPNPDQTYLSSEMMGGKLRAWQKVRTLQDGSTIIAEVTEHDLRWSGGTAYAQLYLHADQLTQGRLSLDFTGDSVIGWLDGREFSADHAANLTLSAGWHSLLLKMVAHLDKGQRFGFSARFSEINGKPLSAVQTRTSDPTADLALNRVAGRLRPLIYVESPANLPHPGDPLRLRVDLRWHPVEQEKELAAPLPRFPAKLRVEIKDYNGKSIALRERQGLYPDIAFLDFGKTPTSGYYTVHATLYGNDGKLIITYPTDGFSVIRGNTAQRERLSQKKLWNNYYYAFGDGDRSFLQPHGYFDWLERMGIFQSYGSYPGSQPDHQGQWEEVRKRRFNVFADTGGDSHWLNDTPESVRDYIAKTAPYTRYFKANNEIDTRREGEWAKLRAPAHWVERAKREHDLLHQVRTDGHYVGGSLVKPGDTNDNAGYPNNLGPGRWFEEVLRLGLDQHVDAWDVHAYPQKPPRFDGPIGNGDAEDERGVLATYARLGRNNILPFWLGEAGAKAAHGSTGRRWQAEQAAKMIAWVNRRADYLGIAFCLSHEYDLGQGRLWDYSMGHKPGEAALYTAGALIDGLPYRATEGSDRSIQAAWFGPTLMAWRPEGGSLPWNVPLDAKQEWVLVDVVGRVEPLQLGSDGRAKLVLGASPVYLLPRPAYRQLLKSD